MLQTKDCHRRSFTGCTCPGVQDDVFQLIRSCASILLEERSDFHHHSTCTVLDELSKENRKILTSSDDFQWGCRQAIVMVNDQEEQHLDMSSKQRTLRKIFLHKNLDGRRSMSMLQNSFENGKQKSTKQLQSSWWSWHI